MANMFKFDSKAVHCSYLSLAITVYDVKAFKYSQFI